MAGQKLETTQERRARYLRLAAEAESEAAELRDPTEQAEMLRIAETWKRLATASSQEG